MNSVHRTFTSFSRKCSNVFLNKYFILALFCGACLITATGKEVVGAVVYLGIICAALLLCEDVMATTMPFLLMCTFVTSCYDSYDTFIKFAPVAVPVVLCILFHFIYYRRALSVGSTFWGLISVSVALLLGGVGFIGAADYFRPMTLYYTVVLGVGMAVFYLLFKSQLTLKRSYDVREKLLSFFYVMGMFACFAVFHYLYKNWDTIKTAKTLLEFQASNNLSTILLFALPCPFYFAKRNKLHLLVPLIMYGCMVMSRSRSGLLLGAVQLILCIVVTAIWDKKNRFFYVCSIIALICTGAAMYDTLIHLVFRVENISSTLYTDEARYKLLLRAKELFPQSPVFGHGLGYTGNTDIYSPVKGAMEWYHMMIPQVVAGLGIVGTIGYLLQFFLRVRASVMAIKKEKRLTTGNAPVVISLVLSFVGVLLMSQVNPGLFCPLPYALMAVMIFATIDGKCGFNPFK